MDVTTRKALTKRLDMREGPDAFILYQGDLNDARKDILAVFASMDDARAFEAEYWEHYRLRIEKGFFFPHPKSSPFTQVVALPITTGGSA